MTCGDVPTQKKHRINANAYSASKYEEKNMH